MILKIYFNILIVALHLTLLISFINGDKNELNLKKKLTHDISDITDSKWWKHLISDSKINKNFSPLSAESVAFDVVQTHLSDDEIPDEEETPVVESTKSKSAQGSTKSSSQRPITTTLRPIIVTTTTQRPTIVQGERKISVKKTTVKSTPKLVTTTTESSSLSESDDEEEEIENNIVKKQVVKTQTQAPARKIPQPTVKRPSPQVSVGGTKTRQQPKVSPKIITTTRPTTTTTEASEEDQDEIAVTTRKPIVQPRKPVIPSRPTGGVKTRPTSTSGGVKTKQAPRPQLTPQQPRQQPRPTTTTEASETDSEDDELPAPKEQPKKVVPVTSRPIQTTTTSRPAAPRGVKRPVNQPIIPPKIGTKTPSRPQQGTKTKQVTVKKVQIQTTTTRPLITTTTEDDSGVDEPSPIKKPAPVIEAKKPTVQPSIKTPARPQAGTKTKPTIIARPTARPTTAIEEDNEEEEIENNIVKKQVVKTQTQAPARKIPQPTVKRPSPQVSVGGTKTRQQPKVSPKIITTTRPTTTTTEASEEDQDEIAVTTRKPIVQPRKPVIPSRPTGGVKTRPTSTSGGVKTKQAPRPQLTPQQPRQQPRPTTTTEASETDSEDDELPAPKVTSRPIQPTTTTRRPLISPSGVKRPPQSQPGTKTRVIPSKTQPRRVQPTTTKSTTIAEEESEEDESPATRPTVRIIPTTKGVPIPATQRPQIQTTTKKTQVESAIEEDNEDDTNEISIPKKPIPAPLPRQNKISVTSPSGVKRPQIQTGTKTRTTSRPQIQTTTKKTQVESAIEEDNEDDTNEISIPKKPIPAPLPKTGGTKTRVISNVRPTVTTSKTTNIEESDDSEDESLPTATVRNVPKANQRPQIQTTTKKPQVESAIEEDNEDDTNEITIPKKPIPAPLPRQNRPSGTKTGGTKTRVISNVRPIITTTTSKTTNIEESDDSEDESLPTATVRTVPKTTQRPQTTRKVVIENDDEDNEVSSGPRRPVPAPLPRNVGTKTPSKRPSGTKTINRSQVTTKTTTESSIDEEDETEAPKRSLVPSPKPRSQITSTTSKTVEEDDDEEVNSEAPAKRPVPTPRVRPRIDTKTPIRKPTIGTKVSSQPSPGIKSRQTPVKVTTTTTNASKQSSADDSDDESTSPVTSQPATQARPAKISPTENSLETDDETDEELPSKRPEISIPETSRPSLSGRKVVNRVSPRIVNNVNTETIVSSVVVTTQAPKKSVSKTREMLVPRPVSFTPGSRRSKTNVERKQEEQPTEETTTLEPIAIPNFESTRRPSSSQVPISQSITIDNEEENESVQLPRRRTVRKRIKRIYSSDLAKFSSRVRNEIRYAERSSNGFTGYSSYSPPLIEPNNESIIEINRIK